MAKGARCRIRWRPPLRYEQELEPYTRRRDGACACVARPCVQVSQQVLQESQPLYLFAVGGKTLQGRATGQQEIHEHRDKMPQSKPMSLLKKLILVHIYVDDVFIKAKQTSHTDTKDLCMN